MTNIRNKFVLSAFLCSFALTGNSFAFIGSIGKAVSSGVSSVGNVATSASSSVGSVATSAASSVGSVATSAASSVTNVATTTTGNVTSGVQSAASGFNASATGGTITIGNTHIGSINAGVTDGQVGVGGNVNVTGIAGGGDVSVGASADGVSGSASASASAGNVGSVSSSTNASVSTTNGNIGASASQNNAANVSVSGIGSVSGSNHTGGQTSVGVSGVSGSASTSGSGSASVSSVGSVSSSSATSASGSAGASGVTGSTATSSKNAASVTGIGSVSNSSSSRTTGDVGASGISASNSSSTSTSASVSSIGSVSTSKSSTTTGSVGASGITGSNNTTSNSTGSVSGIGSSSSSKTTTSTGSVGSAGITGSNTTTTNGASGVNGSSSSVAGTATGDIPTSTTGSTTGDVPTSTTGSTTGDTSSATIGSVGADASSSTTGDTPTSTAGASTGDSSASASTSTNGDTASSTTGDSSTNSDSSSSTGDSTASTGGNDGGEDPIDEPSDPAETPNQERSVSFNVAPLVFGDFTMFSRAVNLKNTSVKSYNNNSLEIYPENSGYLATKVIHYNLGLGVAGYWNFENATGLLDHILPIVGVALIKDKKVEMSGYVKDRERLNNFKLTMPSSVETIDGWNIGDSISYETSGGVMFFGGISSYALGLGQTFVAVGSQKYHIEKISQDVVLVEVIGSETKSAVSSLGLSLSQMSKTHMSRYTNGMSFLINLESDHTRLAYEDLIKGNLIPIQELADDEYNDAVHLLTENTDKLIGKLVSFKVGLPFVPLLSFESIKGKLHGLSRVKEHKNNTRVETEYGVYLSGSKSRFINKYKENLKIFYMGNAELKNSNSEVIGEKSTGHFLWANLNDSSKVRKVKKSLKKLSVATSFPEIFDVKVPGKNKTKLGYSQVAAQFTYNGDFIKHLHFLNSTSVGLESVKENALSLLEDRFSNGLSSDYCNVTDRDARDGVNKCERSAKSNIKRLVKKIEKALSQIESANSKKERSIKFATFGKHVWENPFVFRSMMKLASKCGLSINFDIVGKNIAYFNKKFIFKKTPECKFYNY